ncbi:hypothetical protein [Desulfovibrio sp. JC022]|uniref:hypothetical protein n=1 Tax=Desulfovibrio sp. JC022 TaxID=2593642 RepID=UPI0013D64D15
MKKLILSLIFLGVILCPAFCPAAPSVELLKKITAADHDPGSLKANANYGRMSVISNDTLVVSAIGEDIAGETARGAVYIYYKDSGGAGTWGFFKKITAADLGITEASTNFGMAMALSGNYLIISAMAEDYDGTTNAGRVYILGRNKGGDDEWGLMQVINPVTPASWGQFGNSVAVCGDTIVIGCRLLEVATIADVGSAYVYEPDPDNPGQWKLDKTLVAQDENGVVEREASLQFGSSVDVSGDLIAVGGRGKEAGGKVEAGAVYVFSRNVGAGGWGIVKKLTARKDNGESDVLAGMYFGYDVDFSADLLLVGAARTPVGSDNYVGSAYIFSKDKNGADQWGIVKKLTAVRGDGTQYTYEGSFFGKELSISGDLALVASDRGAYLFSKSQSDVGSWGIVKIINDSETEPDSKLATAVSIHGDYSVVSTKSKTEETFNNAGAAYIFKASNIVSPDSCTDKTVSPTATQPSGTSATVTSVAKQVKTTAEVKKEHQTPGMNSMLGANVYEFTATVTAGKVAYFCFNSSSLGERAAGDVSLFKLFPDKESKSFTYSSGKNPSEEGYFWITDEGNSGQYIDPKMILEGARTYTVNYSVKDNGDYDLDDTPGVINDPVVPGTSGGSGGTGCVLNPQAGFSVELCMLFVVGLLGIIVRGVGRKRALKEMAFSLLLLGLIASPVVSVASPPVELIQKIQSNSALAADSQFGERIAINNDTLAICAPFEDSGAVPRAGAVYLYLKDRGGTGKWGFLKRIVLASEESNPWEMSLGSAVAISNNYLVITAKGLNSDLDRRAGAAYVFGRNIGGNNNWGFVQKIVPQLSEHGGEFGNSVVLCDDLMVIGQSSHDYAGRENSGRAEVYLPDQENQGQWKHHQTLMPQNEDGLLEAQDSLRFAESLAIVDRKIIVGASGKRIGWEKIRAGCVYIYSRDAEIDKDWKTERKIHAQNDDGSSDTTKNLRFGYSLSTSGDLLLVGSRGYTVEGAAYVYSKDKGGADQWGIVKKFKPVLNDGTLYSYADDEFGHDVSLSGDLALIGSGNGAYLFSKSQSDIGTWGIVKRISDVETEPGSKVDCAVAIQGDYCVAGGDLAVPDFLKYGRHRAAYLFKTSNISGPDICADKTVSPVTTQPTGTRAIVTSVTKKVKTAAEIKDEHQTPGMNSMLGANVYEFTASVTAGKVAYFCFNSSSLGERKAEEVALFKLFPNKESKSFTYSSGKNPSEEGYFWITDEGNSGQYIDPKTILVGARTYTINYSVKDNGDYDLDDTPGVILDPVVPGTVSSGGSSGSSGGSTGCVMNPQGGMSMELCGLFFVALLGICVRRISG